VPGEIWASFIDGEKRNIEVIAAGATLGWWTCRDRETGIQFAAREHWFVARLEADEP
jgi:hypothetical protein